MRTREGDRRRSEPRVKDIQVDASRHLTKPRLLREAPRYSLDAATLDRVEQGLPRRRRTQRTTPRHRQFATGTVMSTPQPKTAELVLKYAATVAASVAFWGRCGTSCTTGSRCLRGLLPPRQRPRNSTA